MSQQIRKRAVTEKERRCGELEHGKASACGF